MYVDHAGDIETDLNTIRGAITELHAVAEVRTDGGWDVWTWLKGIWGNWGLTILMWLAKFVFFILAIMAIWWVTKRLGSCLWNCYKKRNKAQREKRRARQHARERDEISSKGGTEEGLSFQLQVRTEFEPTP